MRDAKDEIERRGAKVVVVGNGKPHHARMFAEDENVPFMLWVDPEMKAYAAAGLRRGVRGVFSLRFAGNAVRALRGGHRQTGVKGDPWQNGGVFVINPQGSTLMEQVSREAGDHAEIATILAALDRAAA